MTTATTPIPTTELFRVFIAGTPCGQPRPRGTSLGGRVRMYSPTKIGKGTKAGVRTHPIVIWRQLLTLGLNPLIPREPIDFPVFVTMHFYFPRPAKLMARKATDGEIRYVSKPDADNVAKPILDVMTECRIWTDDTLADITVRRKYVRKDSTRGPGVFIQVTRDECGRLSPKAHNWHHYTPGVPMPEVRTEGEKPDA